MLTPKYTQNSPEYIIKNTIKKNEYKPTKNIFTKSIRKKSMIQLSRNLNNDQKLLGITNSNKTSNKDIVTNINQKLNEINSIYLNNKLNNLDIPVNLSLFVNRKKFANSLKKDMKGQDFTKKFDFIDFENKKNTNENNILRNYLKLSNIKNKGNKISLNIINNNINKIDNNINNVNNVNNSYFFSPSKNKEKEDGDNNHSPNKINLSIKFPTINNSNIKLGINNTTKSRNILNLTKNLTGHLLNNNSSLFNNSSFLNFCSKDQVISFNNDSQSIMFSGLDENCSEKNKPVKNLIKTNNISKISNLRQKFRNLKPLPIKLNYNQSPNKIIDLSIGSKNFKNISFKEVNKSNNENEQKIINKNNTFNKISNTKTLRKIKKEKSCNSTNVNDNINILQKNLNKISENNKKIENNKINNNTNSINNELLIKNETNEFKIEKSNKELFQQIDIINNKEDNKEKKDIKNEVINIESGDNIKKITKENNENDENKKNEKNEINKNNIMKKSSFKYKNKIPKIINEKVSFIDNNIKINNEVHIEKEKIKKEEINNEFNLSLNEKKDEFELIDENDISKKNLIKSEKKERNNSEDEFIRPKRRIKSSHYLKKYILKGMKIENAQKLINEMKNIQFIGKIIPKKEEDIYLNNKFLKKISKKIKDKNNNKLTKFSKFKLLMKKKIEICSFIENKIIEIENIREKQKLFMKEKYIKETKDLIEKDINIFMKSKNINFGINLSEYSKNILKLKKHCGLDIEIVNYIIYNANISSIYIPFFPRRRGQPAPNNKLVLKKNTTKLYFQSLLTKYIETHPSEEKKKEIWENAERHIKIDLSHLKEYKDENIDYTLKQETTKNNEETSSISFSSIKKKRRRESMKNIRNILKIPISSKNFSKNFLDNDKTSINLSPKRLNSQSTKLLYQNKNNLSVLRKSIFYQKTKKEIIPNNQSQIINLESINHNDPFKNEILDEEKFKSYFLKDEKVLEYMKYNPFFSLKKIIREHKIPYYINYKKIEDSFEYLKVLITRGEKDKFIEYFSTVKNNIDINQKDEDGNTLLILCAKNGLKKMATILIENGADINAQNNKGNTALHYAISLKYFSFADILSKYNAKEDIPNQFGYTPWECIGKSVEEKFYS